MFHEQVAPTAATSIPIASVSSHFPTSVLSQEQRDDCRDPSVLQFFKEDKACQEATNEKLENGTLDEGKVTSSFGGLESEHQLSLVELGENPSSYLNVQFVAADSEEIMNVEPSNIVDIAMKALSASKQAAALAEDLKLNLDYSLSNSLGSANSSTLAVEEDETPTVRSTRHFERQSKRKRRQSKFTVSETYSSRKTNVRKKSSGSFNPNDPLRLFLKGPETTQLLIAKEESELIIQVQVELRSGNKSREKLIYANFRLVVHVAKQYQGRGLNLQDLLQEGSMGLIKSVEKFKSQAGCRFATYAYWWIRQTISKSIIQHSRTIRLPENVYSLLGKVVNAKRSYIREGNRRPSKAELASRVGITVEKLDKLLFTARTPLSIQQPVWADQDTTLQEVTPDTGIEIPDVSVEKKLMRQHVRNLLRILNPRERKIIRLRFGIEESRENSLSEVGNMFGLSKERVRQLESKALYKLKQCLIKQGLGAYADLIA
ncbi:hypothetical protein V6N13_059888 [Hibiscus sabdariffa]